MPQIRQQVFDSSTGHEIWVEGEPLNHDSNILLTVSSAKGESTALINQQGIVESKAKLFVEAPPERIVTAPVARYLKIRSAIRWTGYVSAAVLLTFSALSFTGTLKARIVLTGSMNPVIKAAMRSCVTAPGGPMHEQRGAHPVEQHGRADERAAARLVPHGDSREGRRADFPRETVRPRHRAVAAQICEHRPAHHRCARRAAVSAKEI